MLAGMLGTSTGVPWRAIHLGRGGYTLAQFKVNLTVNTDGGTYNASLIDQAVSECSKSNGSSNVHLWLCQQALGTQQPTYILLNFGANDVGFVPPWVLPNQTTWRSDLTSVLDTLHAQWPDALIYITKPWKRQPAGDETVFDTLAASIDTVVATRSTFAFVLDDERIWFKANADGAGDYSNDTPAGTFIHYNLLAGQLAASAAKKAALP